MHRLETGATGQGVRVSSFLHSAEFWILPVALFGAIIGSFLNVVIFRLPRGLSITRPRWSFCPHCQMTIRPLHNLPVLGWLALRGRCHHCRKPIGIIYPLIECATVLIFVMIWDALFIAKVIPGIAMPGSDWPMWVAYLTLFACLMATAVMDIEAYIVDIRLLIFTMVIGVTCHAYWGIPEESLSAADSINVAGQAALIPNVIEISTPANGQHPGAPLLGLLPPSLSVIAFSMGLTWCITVLIARRRRSAASADLEIQPSSEDGLSEEEEADEPTAYLNTAHQRFQPIPILVFVITIGALMFWQIHLRDQSFGISASAGLLRGLMASVIFLFMLVLASLVRRCSDETIIHEIEAESHRARHLALRELGWFLPAILIGVFLMFYFRDNNRLTASFPNAIGMPLLDSRSASHLHGALQAAGAMVLAAALGWAVRILGTLTFGKEAFGTGDIYIMAAMGAVTGFWAVLFSFFLAALLALAGTAVTTFWKANRAVPFGPWLALGAFLNLWVYGSLLRYFQPAGKGLWLLICGQTPWTAIH